jgi:hypothetical protein
MTLPLLCLMRYFAPAIPPPREIFQKCLEESLHSL